MSMSGYGFTRASPEVLAARDRLADQVIRALQRAGLPAFRDGAPATADRAGAVIHIEPDAETASTPVSVSWRCDPAMTEAAVDRLAAGDPTAPVVRYPGTIGLHMQGALIRILLSSGVVATPDNDTMNPDHVLVFGVMSDLPPALRPAPAPEFP
ncbi:hypothetical protein ACFY5F_06320 [Streptomyces sp. NPDC013161]|uniref:hypothetical protein n=1 Tax=Streptomyces sp. NPDC013161 TaxID=3364862 RepID=UPI0036893A44